MFKSSSVKDSCIFGVRVASFSVNYPPTPSVPLFNTLHCQASPLSCLLGGGGVLLFLKQQTKTFSLAFHTNNLHFFNSFIFHCHGQVSLYWVFIFGQVISLLFVRQSVLDLPMGHPKTCAYPRAQESPICRENLGPPKIITEKS